MMVIRDLRTGVREESVRARIEKAVLEYFTARHSARVHPDDAKLQKKPEAIVESFIGDKVIHALFPAFVSLPREEQEMVLLDTGGLVFFEELKKSQDS